MTEQRWCSFEELLFELRIEPDDLKKLIKQKQIVGICFGRKKCLETDWRYLSPTPRYAKALTIQHQILTGTVEVDLGEVPLLTSREFAELCGFSVSRVRELRFRGNIVAAAVVDGKHFYTPNQVRDFLLKRDRVRLGDRSTRLSALVEWFRAYYSRQRLEAAPVSEYEADDEMERRLQKLVALKEPGRSRAIKKFWRSVELAKQVAAVLESPDSGHEKGQRINLRPDGLMRQS